jgi:antitoxin CcdA
VRKEEFAMGYDRAGPKRSVNMSLNEDLVRRARQLTSNLSETVEALLAAYVDDADAKHSQRQRQIQDHIAADAAFVAKHGSIADEFSTL